MQLKKSRRFADDDFFVLKKKAKPVAAAAPEGQNAPVEPTPSPEIVEIEDELADELQLFFSSRLNSAQLDNEGDRVYELNVVMKVGRKATYVVKCTGNERFEDILKRLRSRLGRRKSAFPEGVLIWIDGRLELKPFFKPSTLRIPKGKGAIRCVYVPPEMVSHLDDYEEFSKPEAMESDMSSPPPNSDPEPTVDLGESAPQSSRFVIGLKGADNKRIEVEVGPETTLKSVLAHYLSVKGVSAQNGRLVFDDEDLPLDGLVGDTELEEDFEVQVHLENGPH